MRLKDNENLMDYGNPVWTLCVCVLVKQVFKDMEFLGWYTTGGVPDQSDIHIHKQVGGAKEYAFMNI